VEGLLVTHGDSVRAVGVQRFRAGVVIVVRHHADDRVLAFERNDVPGAWQLPQGGIENGEEPIDAARRELVEETGLGPDDVELIGEHPEWIVYELPAELRAGKNSRGQAQRWFMFRACSADVVPTPDGREFVAWDWVDPDWLVDHVVEFRRPGYRRVLRG
jgi:putative (di)nucleoside polyphosphate hydrolase